MKRIIAGILTTTLLALAPVYGQGVLKKRENNQKARIQEGVKNGSVTKPEAARLKQEQRGIRRDVRRAKSDGVVTGKERTKITREQNKASRHIVRQKHDEQNQK